MKSFGYISNGLTIFAVGFTPIEAFLLSLLPDTLLKLVNMVRTAEDLLSLFFLAGVLQDDRRGSSDSRNDRPFTNSNMSTVEN